MKNTLCVHRAFASALLGAVILLSFSERSRAGTDTWNGNGPDGRWLTGANWSPGTPTAGDSLIFGGTKQLLNTNNFGAGTAFGSITFATPAGAFGLFGNSILLGGNLTNNQALTVETINLSLALTTSPTVSVTDNGALTLAGTVSGSGFGLTKTGNGTLTLSGANTFSGPITNNAGTLVISSDSNLGAVPGVVTPGKLVLNAATLRTTNAFAIDSKRGISVGPTVGSGNGTFDIGTVALGAGLTVSYAGVIANNGASPTGGVVKLGFGGLSLSGANTYSGPTAISNGTLTVDFTGASSPANNIINPNSALTLGGAVSGSGVTNWAALVVTPKAGSVNTQSFNGTTLYMGQSFITGSSNNAGSVTINLGSITNAKAGFVNFILPALNGGLGAIRTTSTNDNGILAGWATVSDGSAPGNRIPSPGTNFASVDASGNIVAYTNYTIYTNGTGNLSQFMFATNNILISDSNSIVAGDVRMDNDGAGTTLDVNTISFLHYAQWTFIIGSNNTLRLGKNGALFSRRNDGGLTWVVGGGTAGNNGGYPFNSAGTITAGGPTLNTPGQLYIINNTTASASAGNWNIDAQIADNGSGAVTLVKAGPGFIKLRNKNTYSGNTYILQGRVQLENGLPVTGATNLFGSGDVFVFPGGNIFYSTANGGATPGSLPNRFFVGGASTQQEPQIGALRTVSGWVITNLVTLIGDTTIGGNGGTGGAIAGKITGPFSLSLCSGGTVNGTVSISNPSNDWSGNTIIQARTLDNTAGNNVFTSATNEAIPDGLGKGNVTILDGVTTTSGLETITWNLTGFTETINGLSTSGVGFNSFIQNNSATLPASLIVGGNDQSGSYSGTIRNGAAAALSLTKIGGGTETLSGTNLTFTGNTLVNGGTLALSGAAALTNSAIQVTGTNGLATLDITGVTGGFNTTKSVGLTNGALLGNTSTNGISTLGMTNSQLTLVVNQSVTNVYAGTLNTGGTSNLVNLTAVQGVSGYPAVFRIMKYTTFNSNSFFILGSVPSPSTVGFITNDPTTATVVLVLTDGPKAQTWKGNDGTNPTYWDNGVTVNWLAFNSTPSVFNTADTAIFDDAGVSTTVDLRETVNPAIVTNTGTKSYTFIGAGNIAGVGSLVKQGSGTLTLLNTGGDSYKGGVTVGSGEVIFGTDNTIGGGINISNTAVVQVGTNGISGTLPTGGAANDGTILFDNTASVSYSGVISGSGALTNIASGEVTLSGVNTFTGPVAVNAGSLRAGNNSALGTANNPTYVASGARLDVNGVNLSSETIFVQGTGITNAGAIVNFGATGQNNALTNVVLQGDTRFGGSARWDIRSASAGSANAALSGNFNLTKVGNNEIRLADVTIDPSTGIKDIDIQSGTLSLEGATTSAGATANTLTVEVGATFQVVGLTTPLDKTIVLNGGLGTNNTLSTAAGTIASSFINSSTTITMTGTNVFNAGANSLVKVKAASGINGTASMVKVGAGTNILDGSIGYTGTTTVSNGMLMITGSKAAAAGITVASGGTLGGNGTLSESVVANGQLLPGDPLNTAAATALSINGNLTLNANTNTFVIAPGNGNSGMLDQINNLVVNGTATIQIRTLPSQPLVAGQVNTLFRVSGASVGTNSFVIAPLQGYTFELLTNADTKSIDLHVITAVADLLWDGKPANGGVWNTVGAASWKTNGTPGAQFHAGDFVTFDENAAITNVNITGDVGPAPGQLMSFNGVNVTYWLTGVASITGSTGMRIGALGSSPGSLVIANSSNTFTGPIMLDNGSLQIGAGGSAGSVGTANIIMTNVLGGPQPSQLEPNPTPLVLNRGDSNLVVSGSIIGHIAVTNIGSGMVTLSGNNTFTGGLYVANGTLRIDNNGALGPVDTNGNVIAIISNNAALDVGGPTAAANALNVGSRPIMVQGAGPGGRGVIVNSATNQQQNVLLQVVLAGDATFGGGVGVIWTNAGNPGRWDMRGAVTSTNAILTSSNNPYNLTKVGSNQVSFVGVIFDTNIANIEVQGGQLGFEQGTISMGNPNSNLTVRAAATLEFFHSAGPDVVYTKNFVLNGDGILPTINSGTGSSTVNGTMSLNGPCIFTITGTSFTNLCTLSGGGSLIKTNGGELILAGSGGYTGNTTISDGTLSLAGSASLSSSPIITFIGTNSVLDVTGVGGSIARGSSQTIQGNGTVWGSLTANSSSTVSPGGSVGVLTVTNAITLNPGSTTLMEIDAGLGTNDQLIAGTTLQYGGSLIITTNGNGNLSGGQTFKLFAFGSAPTGTFSLVSLPDITPLSWNTNLLAGTVSVVAAAVTSPTNSAGILSSRLIGTNLVVHGTNNNIPNTAFHYAVMTSTNILTPLSNWTSVVTNAFDAGGTFDYTNPVTPGSSSRLFIDTRAVP